MNEEIRLHGEVCIKKRSGLLESGLRVVEPKNGVYKIADSEVTGNHHLLEEVEGVEMYEKDGMFYIRPDKPMTVKCVIKERHDEIVLPPCKPDEFYEIFPQQEIDHLTEEVRACKD